MGKIPILTLLLVAIFIQSCGLLDFEPSKDGKLIQIGAYSAGVKILAIDKDEYLILGITSTDRNHFNPFIRREKHNQKEVWTKTLPVISDQYSKMDMIKTENGNFLISGTSKDASDDFKERIFLIEINANGEIINEKYWENYGIEFSGISEVQKNQMIITGVQKVDYQDFSYIWKVNSSGEIINEIFLPDTGMSLNGALWLNNNEVFVFGSIKNQKTNSTSAVLQKYDAQINQVWDTTFVEQNDRTKSILSTALTVGDYSYIGGYSYHSYSTFDGGEYDCWVMQIDEEGSIIWTNNFGGDKLKQMIPYSGDEIIIIGDNYSEGSQVALHNSMDDVYLARFNSSGILQNSKSYDHTRSDYGNSGLLLNNVTIRIIGEASEAPDKLDMLVIDADI